ncbi:MAG: phage holin family protein [Parcubacteria group bacterium]|nr:phage holin family protein [Parcubacteria group bacterium]
MILIAKWLIVALSFLLAAYYVPGISVETFYTALILAFVWGVISLLFRPILIFLTLPITLITFGLFTLVINALLFMFLSTFVKGFEVEGFVSAFLGALIVSLASWFGNKVLSHLK